MIPAPRIHRPEGAGRFVILCDHASNHIPAELNDLGLPPSELTRHIAYDIGAGAVAEILADTLDSPAIFSSVSRLVIDCNRHLTAADLIPEISDRTQIPGNLHLSPQARLERIEHYFQPYHDAVESVIAPRTHPIILSVHSMTDNLNGNPRPWQISLSSYQDRSLADPILAALRLTGDITVGDNEPYDLDPAFDYSIPFHALRRGLPHIQVEFRQDEIGTASGQFQWAQRFADGLRSI